jgi:hypothetical protein
LQAIWTNRPVGSSRVQLAQRATLWLCLFLLALLSVAQVAHTHKDASDADHCTICVVLQNAAPTTIAAVAILFFALARVVPVERVQVAVYRPISALFIRPPPIG